MKINRFQDASQFYEQVKDYLLNHEALHNVQLALCNSFIQNPERFDEKPYLATVEVDGDVIAVAMKTPGRKLLLSKIEDFGSIEVIAQDIRLTQESLSGVNAPTAEAKAFAEAWHSLTGQSYHLKMALRAFQLEQVQAIPKTTGDLRIATESDLLKAAALRYRQVLIPWYKSFALEALGNVESEAERKVEHLLHRGIAYIWEDKIPVSMACHVRVMPNGAAVSLVYTPPEHRRKGYASACVAALSQTLLNQGHRYCFLFTDLANPTSNHIYQAIGYLPVGDLSEYSFTENTAVDVTA